MNFIADVHLGKLARLLRMAGFDTVYNNAFSLDDLLALAVKENKVLLSRNNFIKPQKDLNVFFITDENPEKQLKQVINHFNVKNQVQPFTRCIVCNGNLQAVLKAQVIPHLQPQTILHFNEFWQCDTCNRIYWKGSHYERMNELIEKIKADT